MVRRLASLAITALLVVLASGCSDKDEKSTASSTTRSTNSSTTSVRPPDPDSVPLAEEEVRAALNEFLDADRRRDVPAMGRMLSEDAQIEASIPGVPEVKKYAKYSYLQQATSSFEKYDAARISRSVTNGNIVIAIDPKGTSATASYQEDTKLTSPNGSFDLSGSLVVTLQRVSGKVLITKIVANVKSTS